MPGALVHKMRSHVKPSFENGSTEKITSKGF